MRYRETFEIVKSEEEAKNMCDRQNSVGNAYKRKRYHAHYTPWSSRDGSEVGFVVWYYV